MKKKFLSKCLTTLLAASLAVSSVNAPAYANEPQVTEAAETTETSEADESSSLYTEESEENSDSTSETDASESADPSLEESTEPESEECIFETNTTAESETTEETSFTETDAEEVELESTDEAEEEESAIALFSESELPIPTNPSTAPVKDMSYLYDREGTYEESHRDYYIYYEDYIEAYSGRAVGEVLDKGVIFPYTYDKETGQRTYKDSQYAIVNWEVEVMGYEVIECELAKDGRFNLPILKLKISLNENSKTGDWSSLYHGFTTEAFKKTVYDGFPWEDSIYSLGYYAFIEEIEIGEGIESLPANFSFVLDTFGKNIYYGEKRHYYWCHPSVDSMLRLKKIDLPQSLKTLNYQSLYNINTKAVENVLYHPTLKTIRIENCYRQYGDEEYIGIKLANNFTKIEQLNGYDGIIHIPSTVTEIAYRSVGYEDCDSKTDQYKLENVTIAGVTGSAAHKYAEDNGFPFKEMGDDDELVELRMDHKLYKNLGYLGYVVRKKGDTYGHLLDKEFEITYKDGNLTDKNGNLVPYIVTEQYVVDYFEDKNGNRITEDTVVQTERDHVVYVRCHLTGSSGGTSGGSGGSSGGTSGGSDGSSGGSGGTSGGSGGTSGGTSGGGSSSSSEPVVDEVEEEDKEQEQAKIWIGGVKEEVPFTGNAITFPGIRVYDGKTLLKHGIDYSVSYANNKNAGTAKIVVAGMGQYKGKTAKKTFRITALDISSSVVANGTSVYTGKTQRPNPAVTHNGKALEKNKDYTVTYGTGLKEKGTYTITITGKGNYSGKKTVSHTIVEKNAYKMLSKATVSKVRSKAYTGSEIVQNEYVVKFGNNVLVEGVDYTTSYINNTNVGTATIVFTAVEGSKYIGEKTVNFKINGTPIAKTRVEIDYQNPKNKSFEYTGFAIKPTFTVEAIATSESLTEDVDYTVAYQKNKAKGTGFIILTGKGKYTGVKKIGFKIVPMKLTEENTRIEMASSEYKYTGKPIKPAFKVVVKDKTLVRGRDYTVRYANNKKVSASDSETAPTITVKGKGDYSGSLKVTFSIVSK